MRGKKSEKRKKIGKNSKNGKKEKKRNIGRKRKWKERERKRGMLLLKMIPISMKRSEKSLHSN